MNDEIYVSTDVEADGPIPGPHSMLSFASAAFRADKSLVGTFTRNLELLPGAAPDPRPPRGGRPARGLGGLSPEPRGPFGRP